MEQCPEDSLFQAVITNDQDTVSHFLSQGANPNKILKNGNTCLGEVAKLGNIDILRLLIKASRPSDTSNKVKSCSTTNQKSNTKCQKRKLKHQAQYGGTVVKLKNSSDRSKGSSEKHDAKGVGVNKDKNQGYFVVRHNDASSSDESKVSLKSMSPYSLTPSPESDLEWDEDIGCFAPTTSEDEKWASMYRWYAAILESTGAAIASASGVDNGIDQQDAFSQTALHYAVEYGHIEVVQLLVEAGCKVDIEAGDGINSLHVAVIKCYMDIIKILLKAGAHINYKTHAKMTPLHFAAIRGFLDIVQFLVNNGAYIDARDTHERTALYIAAGRDHVDVVKYLISVGANVNGEEINGYTPLCEAVWQNNTRVVEVLLSSGARITHSHRLLHVAIIQRQENVAKMLTVHGGGINLHNDDGDTPLLLAVRLKQFNVATMLLAKGANVNSSNSITGSTALHIAVENIDISEHFEKLLKCLIEYKIDMDATALTGDTALNRALLLFKYQTAVLLIRYGADVNTCDLNSCGFDNLYIASQHSACVASMLIKAGHYIMAPDPSACVPKTGCGSHCLYDARSHPLTLSDLCRIKIRYMAKNRILHNFIFSLPLPMSLKRFLMMEDEGLDPSIVIEL